VAAYRCRVRVQVVAEQPLLDNVSYVLPVADTGLYVPIFKVEPSHAPTLRTRWFAVKEASQEILRVRAAKHSGREKTGAHLLADELQPLSLCTADVGLFTVGTLELQGHKAHGRQEHIQVRHAST